MMTKRKDKSAPVVQVEGLTKKFGSFTAVDHISFHVQQGEIFGFLGANGAGKSTAISMLCGILKPTSGSGTVAGYDILHQGEEIKKHIGVMSQRFALYTDLTVEENLRLYAAIYGMRSHAIRERTDELLEQLDFAEYRKTRAGHLPLGWKQKLAFASAIFHRPEVVFLDEPTGGVDPLTRRLFWELIYDVAYHDGITVFVTTHYMDEAEYCDRVSIMVDGEIKVLGPPAELKEEYHATDMTDLFTTITREGRDTHDRDHEQ